MTVELSPAQRARSRELGHILGAAEQCDLWFEPDGTSVLTAKEYFGLSDPIDTVTEEVELARKAGFLVAQEFPTDAPGGSWRLTTAGENALAFYRAEMSRR